MKKYFTEFHYKKEYNYVEKLILAGLKPFSAIYSLVVQIRLFLYKINILKQEKIDAYVISLGNITTGGTGKTPIVAEIANYLTSLGLKNAIISRGYAGKLSLKNTNIISDGDNIYFSADLSGEEPFWLAENCPKSVVITGKNRVKSAQKAIQDYNCKFIILDDGFQHLKMQRDLNIVVIDAQNVFGNGYTLPLGPLREPISQIKRSDVIIITDKFNSQEKADILKNELANKYKKPVVKGIFKPDKIYNIKSNALLSSEIKNVIAFCGIGQPKSFFNYIKEMGLNISEKIIFEDHHIYNEDDMIYLKKVLDNQKNSVLLTTEKDAVKLSMFLKDLDVYALKLKLEIDLNNLLKDLKNEK